MWWSWLKWLGLTRAVVAATALSIAVSAGLTAIMQAAVYQETGGWGLLIAIIAPLIIAPPFSYLTFRLLFQLDRAQSELRQLATTDELTQACNRRHFIELVEQEFARAQRYGSVFCLAIFDLDDFKSINDRYGHAAGDVVLREVSRECQELIRQSDVFARYGGEEFVLLLPQADEAQGHEVAQRLQNQIARRAIVFDDQPIRLTASVGLAAYHRAFSNCDALLRAADAALYAAKAAGKNCLVVATSAPAPPAAVS